MSRHRYTETAFEAAIEEHLLNYGGYQKRTTESFDPELCLIQRFSCGLSRQTA